MSNADNQSFCVLPWIHLNVNPDGAVTLCCQSHHPLPGDDGQSLNAQTHSLREIWNSSVFKDIRRRMAAGEKLPHCKGCFNNEAYGRDSYRTQSNRRWLDGGSALDKTIASSADGRVRHLPLYLDLRIGNVCNLKCTACKPLYSSQIERDSVHAQWVIDAPYQRLGNRFGSAGEWSDAPGMLDEIVELSPDVMMIQLAGGEPTVNRTQMAFLQHLCETGRAGSIELKVASNLSNVRKRVFDIFGQFKSLSVSLSIDGAGATYEYVRFPGKWAALTRNIERLRAQCPGAGLRINAVLQAVNAYNVVELFDWADEAGIPIGLSIGRGLDHYNDFRILPLAMREECRARFDDYFRRKSNRQDLSTTRAQVESIFTEMSATAFPEALRQERMKSLMRFVNDMDRSRGLSFKDAAPDMYADIVADHGHWDTATRYA